MGIKIPFTIKTGEEIVEDTVGMQDVFSYEDHFRSSFGKAYDSSGDLTMQGAFRLSWIALRARHGERRSFDEWLEEADPEVILGHVKKDAEEAVAADPTGETPTQPDDESPVSPSSPESPPTESLSSPEETPDSSTPTPTSSSTTPADTPPNGVVAITS